MKTPMNIPVLMASLLVSLCLWFVAQSPSQEPPRTLILKKLSIQGLDTTRWVAVGVPSSVKTSITCSQEDFNALSTDESVEGVIDLKEATPGRHAYKVKVLSDRFRNLFDPALEVTVDIEARVERRFHVNWDTRGELSEKTLRLDDVLVEPANVVVAGPRSLLQRVARARAVLDLGQVDPSVRKAESVGVEVLDASGKPIQELSAEPAMVNLTPAMSPAPQEKLAFILPNVQGRPAIGSITAGYEIEPNQVRLRGRSQALAATSQLSTEPIDIEGITRTRTFNVRLVLPEGVESMDGKRVRVTIYIRPAPRLESTPTPGTLP